LTKTSWWHLIFRLQWRKFGNVLLPAYHAAVTCCVVTSRRLLVGVLASSHLSLQRSGTSTSCSWQWILILIISVKSGTPAACQFLAYKWWLIDCLIDWLIVGEVLNSKFCGVALRWGFVLRSGLSHCVVPAG
jgi:hypothetical protein